MKLIAHRGNVNGPIQEMENSPDYVMAAIEKGYDVEIDLWKIDKVLKLGHDKPHYKIQENFLTKHIDNLWIHAKNLEAMDYLHKLKGANYFWHDKDVCVLTSKGFIWYFTSKQVHVNGINLMPEFNNIKKEDLKGAVGICSDYVERYK